MTCPLRFRSLRRALLASAVAGVLALPATALAGRWDKDDARQDDRREHREDRRDDNRRAADAHDRRSGGSIRVELEFGRDRDRQRYDDCVEYEKRVWVEPVYRTVCDRVWVEPTYRTVTERVWREPVYEERCERVWVPERYERREVRFWDGCGWRVRFERVCVEPGRWETRTTRVCVREGYWEDVCRRELVCEGRWQTIERRELVSEGYWTTKVVREKRNRWHGDGYASADRGDRYRD